MTAEALPTTAIGGRLVRAALVVAVFGAVLAVVVAATLGQLRAGAAVAVGLLLGSVNGMVTARMIRLPLPFVASSMLRLVTLSMIGVAIGFALGVSVIWLVILGIGIAQILLAGSAIRELMGQR